jgi:squalene--tetrahymanol cyclase
MLEKLHKVIERAKEHVWQTQKDSRYWNYAAYFGQAYTSQYFFTLHYLGVDVKTSKLNVEKFKEIILGLQRENGGWQQVPDSSTEICHLDSTIFNYWFLKASQCLDINEPRMLKARCYILQQGGLQAASHHTKIWLCLFGNYEWQELAAVPLFPFRDDSFYQYSFLKDWMAQWAYPHGLPVAYLRYFRKQKYFPHELFDLSELNMVNFTKVIDHRNERNSSEPCFEIKNIIDKMHSLRRSHGTYGAYGSATVFTLIAFDDWNENYARHGSTIEQSLVKESLDMIEQFYFNNGDSSYLGVISDGRWWDSMLLILALLECGEDKEKLLKSVEYLKENGAQRNGAMPFGFDFEETPDADCTSIWVMILARLYKEEFQADLDRANKWLLSMQNTDGGFGAFDKGRRNCFFYQLVFGGLCKYWRDK